MTYSIDTEVGICTDKKQYSELGGTCGRIADKAPTEEKERCVSEGVESLQRSYVGGKDNRSVLRTIVRHFHDSDLSLLLSDKEGSFTVLPKKLFGEKAMLAINKNFKLADTRPARAKTRAVKMLEELNLEALAKRARNSKLDVLKMFFAAKTHKVECPFRAIVTERDSWQAQVSRFLQLHLSNLIPEDPYKVSSSDHLIDVLREGLPGVNNAFSLDVEELFYSVPHDELLVAVRELIETSGVYKISERNSHHLLNTFFPLYCTTYQMINQRPQTAGTKQSDELEE
ncbi:uncharacterized protein LOC120838957 [Ixodes scapularis]|uniref:uncharacterized protein LOC120838957 n=1 Tax=Ixodes scapularis TaxID=6945 RepID=UPI001C37EB72|nr:uncharacterized protein LOC120838957 [Ixodes scapularis]